MAILETLDQLLLIITDSMNLSPFDINGKGHAAHDFSPYQDKL